MFNKIYDKIKKFILENKFFFVGLIIVILMFSIKLPYVVYKPGGVVSLNERIKLENSHDINGKISMSYVSAYKGNIPIILLSFIIPNWDLVNNKKITIDNNGDMDALLKLEKLQMDSSVDAATIVAYQKANKTVNIKNELLNVIYFSDKYSGDIKLFDIIKRVNNVEVSNLNELKNEINKYEVGEKINIKVLRDNQEVNTSSTVYIENDIKLIGAGFITTYDIETDPKINVKMKESESGSSGGLMLSLAIYEKLTGKNITKGKNIVGTGTIDKIGNVGKIDGIKYKMLGASKNKADIFLCPYDNYEEALEIKNKHNLEFELISVNTFEETLELLENNN